MTPENLPVEQQQPKLTEKELRELVHNYDIETEKGENRRWSRTNETIVELKGRYFSICWD